MIYNSYMLFIFLLGIIYVCPTTSSLTSSKYSSADYDYNNGKDTIELDNDFLKFLQDIYSSSREAQYPILDEQDVNDDLRSRLRQNDFLDYAPPSLDYNENEDYNILYDLLRPENDNFDFAEQTLDDLKDSARTNHLENEEDKEQLLITALLEDMLDDVDDSQINWDEIAPENYYEDDFRTDKEKPDADHLQEDIQTLKEDFNNQENLPNSDGKKERGQKQVEDEVINENSEERNNDKREFSGKDNEEKPDAERSDVDELRSLLTEMENSETDEKPGDQDAENLKDVMKSDTTASSGATTHKNIKIDVALPGVSVSKDDTYLCTGVKIADYTNSTDKPLYIVEYQPHAKQAVAHHMLLYGCKTPGVIRPGAVWNCGGVMEGVKKKSDGYPIGSLCGSGSSSTILWAWAKDAPEFKLPKDVGFKIGKGTEIQYLVLQVHYKSAKVFKDGFKDHSAVSVISTYKRKPLLAGVYILASSMGTVLPHETKNFDIECRYKQPFTIHPFAFRTHAHALGVEVIGFRVRDAEWTLIGAKSPQLPEAFYPVANKNMTIRYNDWLAARCVMHNFRNVATSIGYRHTDEMCNFYIMFWVEAKYEDNLDKWQKSCNSGFPWVHWSSLPGYYN